MPDPAVTIKKGKKVRVVLGPALSRVGIIYHNYAGTGVVKIEGITGPCIVPAKSVLCVEELRERA